MVTNQTSTLARRRKLRESFKAFRCYLYKVHKTKPQRGGLYDRLPTGFISDTMNIQISFDPCIIPQEETDKNNFRLVFKLFILTKLGIYELY